MTMLKDIWYFAGIIDGEGCFCIFKTKGQYRLILSVTNTSLVLVNWLQSHFGGKVYKRRLHNPRWKERYEWVMPMYDVDPILKSLKGVLVIKREQLEIATEFRKTFEGKRTYFRLDDKRRGIRERCWKRMRELNKKGNPSVETIQGTLRNEMKT